MSCCPGSRENEGDALLTERNPTRNYQSTEENFDRIRRQYDSRDEFCEDFYKYYRSGGFTALVLRGILHLLTMIFLFLLLGAVCFLIDYKGLRHMVDDLDELCPNETDIPNPTFFGHDCHGNSAFNHNAYIHPGILEIIFIATFSILWVVDLVIFVRECRHARGMRQFFQELDVSESRLQNMRWEHLFRLLVLHEFPQLIRNASSDAPIKPFFMAAKHPLHTNQASVNTMDEALFKISAYFHRRSNIIRLLFHDVLDKYLRSHWQNWILFGWLSCSTPKRWFTEPHIPADAPIRHEARGIPQLSEHMMWVLEQVIFNYLLQDDNDKNSRIQDNHKKRGLRRAYYRGPQTQQQIVDELRARCLRSATVQLLVSPFVVLYRIAIFVFKHTDVLRDSPGYFATRRWSPYAKWKFRCLNETECQVERRLSGAFKNAEKFINHFRSHYWRDLAEALLIMLGAVVLAFLVVSFIFNDSVLLIDLSPNRSVAWYLAIAFIILRYFRSVADSGEASDASKHIRALDEELLHPPVFLPEFIEKADYPESKSVVSHYLPYKGVVAINEIIAPIVCPFFLFFVIDRQVCTELVRAIHAPADKDKDKFIDTGIPDLGFVTRDSWDLPTYEPDEPSAPTTPSRMSSDMERFASPSRLISEPIPEQESTIAENPYENQFEEYSTSERQALDQTIRAFRTNFATTRQIYQRHR